MPPSLEEVLAGWEGLGVVSRRDGPTGAWIFVALHDDRLGPPTGGTRYNVYASPAAAATDALRLATGMTSKWAVIGVPFGGGKAVIAPPGPLEEGERRALLRRYGRLVESLGGAFVTGEDLGTTPGDMAEISSQTVHVLGAHGGAGDPVDPGPFTARGVVQAMAALLERLDGEPAFEGLRVAVQGVGDVGGPLARELAGRGARLLLSDVDGARARALAEELGGESVEVDAIYEVSCDVFAPCAIGAVLSLDTVPRLACRAVCGSANNQLASPEDADRLHRRGILYAPDYVANAGGAIAFAHLWGEPGAGRADLMAGVDRVRDIMGEILAEAAERDEPPLVAAQRRVERALAAADARRG